MATYHLVGIGGIGMSGLARMLHAAGHTVQGTDQGKETQLPALEALGLKVWPYHDAETVEGATEVVVSSAVHPNHPEVQRAKALGLRVRNRVPVLLELLKGKRLISIAGSHGKTSTTSLTGWVLETLDPTVVAGGVMNAYDSNVRLGAGPWAVVETDESDRTLALFHPELSVVTSIDHDHLEAYNENLEELTQTFAQFADQTSGTLFLRAEVLRLDQLARPAFRNARTFGVSPGQDWQLLRWTSTPEGLVMDVKTPLGTLAGIAVNLWGEHNALNALAALAVAQTLGVSETEIRGRLTTFPGTQRRMTRVGIWNGATIWDDYAHNETKVLAALSGARSAHAGRILAVFQPHRYTRLARNLQGYAEALALADCVVLLPVYAAGEKIIEGAESSDLLRLLDPTRSVLETTFEAAKRAVQAWVQPGDWVLSMGAGDNTKLSRMLAW